MRFAVVHKWARDPADAHVAADSSVAWLDSKTAISDDDPAAAQVTLAGPEDEIVGVTLGEANAGWVLARGAGRAIAVTGAPLDASSSEVAAIRTAAIRRIGDVDVVLIGGSLWDTGVGACITGQLGWPVLAGLSNAEITDGPILATRRLGSATQILEAAAPGRAPGRCCAVSEGRVDVDDVYDLLVDELLDSEVGQLVTVAGVFDSAEWDVG